MIRRLFTRIRQTLFEWRLEREIYHHLFPHLEHEADHGYSFQSDEQFTQSLTDGELDAQLHLKMIAREAEQMPKAYGEAFRFIAYRDLNRRLAMYRRLARRRIHPRTCDPRFVATKAA